MWADACSTRGALLAQEPVAVRTVVTTGASAFKVQMPATAPPWLRGHDSRRLLSRLVTARHSRSTRSSGPVRCVGVGHGGMCCHSSFASFPGWANEMACLQRVQIGAIQASLRSVGWTAATPSVTAAPNGSREQRQGTRAACAATRSTEAGRGTTGYYMARPARVESSLLRGRPPVGDAAPL